MSYPIPELLALPEMSGSSGQKLFSVRVKINGQFGGAVPDRELPLAVILNLLSQTDGYNSVSLQSLMSFDNFTFEIRKYEFDPIKQRLIIHARDVPEARKNEVLERKGIGQLVSR
ncbi:hypothetical protein [Iodobacter ciconiae]|uniref:Uncharacterized protein n=1 Tax=Iodobacter ciconiae TaxID=2496266 RepID=A0A3S8ZPT1_9NEIS|nr:hypothetical protein [Iodobacter ciconiae]AZN35483.1 hypothetical protein EJO50_02660 [Iodobacter ciconiae]